MNPESLSYLFLRIKQYSNLVILAAGIWLISKSLLFIGIPLVWAWYSLFGFIGISRMFAKIGMRRTSNFFLAITLPFALIPSFKAWYYLAKGTWHFNRAVKGDLNKWSKVALCYNKVQVDNFTTINEKVTYYMSVASNNLLAGDRDGYEECIFLAECIDGELGLYSKRINEFKQKMNKYTEAESG